MGVDGAGIPIPELWFVVEEAAAMEFAAIPTLRFALRLTSGHGEAIRSVALTVQLRVAALQRAYDAPTQARLAELFGEPSRWATSARSLFWTQATLIVPAFEGSTRVDLPVACTYDFDVAVVKYLGALADGEIPLELLFSGTMFYLEANGALRAARISHDREAAFRLPVRVWREMMDRYYPDSAWLRVRRESLERLAAFRARHTLATWDDVLDALLGEQARGAER